MYCARSQKKKAGTRYKLHEYQARNSNETSNGGGELKRISDARSALALYVEGIYLLLGSNIEAAAISIKEGLS